MLHTRSSLEHAQPAHSVVPQISRMCTHDTAALTHRRIVAAWRGAWCKASVRDGLGVRTRGVPSCRSHNPDEA
jgi:hypothetical protein